MGDAGSKRRNEISLDFKESSEVHRPARAQQSHAQVRQRAGNRSTGEGNRTSSPRGKPECARETASGREPVQWDHRACGGTHGRSGQNTEGCAGATHWDQSPPRRKDTVLAGGIRCVLDEQVRHRQRRKDTAAREFMAERTTHRSWNLERRSCTCQPSQPEEEKWEPRFHPGVFCWHAELVVRGSGSSASKGLAVKTRVGERQENILGRRDWTIRIDILGIASQSGGPQTAVTTAFDIQFGMERDPRRWCFALSGEMHMENKVAMTYFAEQTSNNGVSVKVVLGTGT